METKIKTGVLIAACITTVFTLSFIQYYLVKNTYILTRNNYYTEVRKSMTVLTNHPTMVTLQDGARENLRNSAEQYTNGLLTKQEFLANLTNTNTTITKLSNQYIAGAVNKNPILKGTRFKSRYDEIIIQYQGHADTLLNEYMKPIAFLGIAQDFKNGIFLNKDVAVTRANHIKKTDGKKSSEVDMRILVKQSNYADISSWKIEVFRRMAGVFTMAVALILAVTGLFYLIFHALLQQKKIAEIKTDFANNVTHELKTPLSSVSLILKSIHRPDVQSRPEMLNDLLKSLDRQHKKIQHLVDSVLESSMVSAVPVAIQETEISKLMLAYVQDIAIPAHQLKSDITTQPTVLCTNAIIIEKILNILIDNAAKYSGSAHEILLKTYLTEQHYVIGVTDHGPGISEIHQKHIFDKFYRVPEQYRHTVKGLGLGLYLAKQSAMQIGAQLTVQSEQGLGCTFQLKLPL